MTEDPPAAADLPPREEWFAPWRWKWIWKKWCRLTPPARVACLIGGLFAGYAISAFPVCLVLDRTGLIQNRSISKIANAVYSPLFGASVEWTVREYSVRFRLGRWPFW